MLLAIILGVIALAVALAYFNMWALRAVVYESLSLDSLAPLLRSWGPWLAERGRIVVRHTDTTAEVELRKHRYSTKPDLLIFRARNADATRHHFAAIRTAFQQGGIDWQLETTPKRNQPRAIAVPLPAEDIHTPAAACRLIRIAFAALGATEPRFRAHCEGSMRVRPDVPAVPLLPWRQDYALAFRLGSLYGKALHRWRTPR